MELELIEVRDLVLQLKAAGEITRLRLLVLLAQGELSVKDLTQVLEQSQPRISRHLRLLVKARLVVRHAEGAWVYYGINSDVKYSQFTYSLISRLALDNEQLSLDRERLKKLQMEKKQRAEKYFSKIASNWDKIRSLHISEIEVEAAIVSLVGNKKYNLLLDLGTGTGRMLELLRNNYQRAIGVDSNHEMTSIARAKLASSSLTHAQIRLADIEQLDEYEASADMVVLHQVLHYFADPKNVIFHVSNLLTHKGKILIVDFAPHDFEILRDVHAHLRMGISVEQMQFWAKSAGLKIVEHLEIPNNKQKDGLTVCLYLLENDR